MATFTPPLRDGNPMTAKWASSTQNALMRHYGSVAQGITVWKDTEGVWHESLNPYLGGATHAQHNNWSGGVGPTTTTQGPDEGIATAERIYHGGHTYELNILGAIELFLAGYVLGGHKDDEEQKWIDYALISTINKDYKGGDGCASLKRSGGESLWVFADNFIGTLDADGTYNFALPARNAMVVQSAAGAIAPTGAQVYHDLVNQPAFQHPSTPTSWWWPIDIINDGVGLANGDVVVACWNVTNGGMFGSLVGNTFLTLNVFGGVSSTVDHAVPAENFFVQSIYNNGDFHYIHGLEYAKEQGGYNNYTLDTDTYSRLARVPVGSLRTAAAWEYWNGVTWSTSQVHATRIKDHHGALIEGNVDLTKVGDTYILAALSTDSPALTLYRAPAPTGPWVRYHVEDSPKPPTGGRTPGSPGAYAYYLPKFHEHLNPSDSQLVASYNRNIFAPTGSGGGLAQTDIHVSTFCPQFLWLPGPDV